MSVTNILQLLSVPIMICLSALLYALKPICHGTARSVHEAYIPFLRALSAQAFRPDPYADRLFLIGKRTLNHGIQAFRLISRHFCSFFYECVGG